MPVGQEATVQHETGAGHRRFDPESVRRVFDRPEVAAVYLFGSVAVLSPHALSDVDLAYLGTDALAEERAFDELYEALQSELGEGRFDLVPLPRAPLHIQFAVATEGKPLLVRDPALAEAFGTRAIARYLDFKPCRDRYFSGAA
jgi:predicted nucleotidyltransferase